MKRIFRKLRSMLILIFKYGDTFKFNNIIIFSEFITALVLSNIIVSFGVIDKAEAAQVKIFADKNVVICDTDNEDQILYCNQNGKDIGGINNFIFLEKDDFGEIYNGIIYDDIFLSEIKMPLYKGKWFEYAHAAECDIVSVISYKYRNDFKVGSTYELKCGNDIYRVYISGIMDPHIDILGDFICKDKNHILDKEKQTTRYYELLAIDASSLARLDIENFTDLYKMYNENSKKDVVWNNMFIVTVLFLFFAGYTGDQILHLDSRMQRYAVLILCGMSAKRSFIVQFIQNLCVIFMASLTGGILLEILYKVQFTNQYFVVNIFVCIILSAVILQTVITAFYAYLLYRKSAGGTAGIAEILDWSAE